MDRGPRLAAATIAAAPASDRSLLAVSRGVCPYVGALIDGILGAQIGTVRFSAALVLTTVCDQMRYAAALLKSRTDGPIFLLNVPSTWQTAAARELYRAELRRLGRFLVQLGGKSPTNADLAEVMRDHDRAAQRE